MSLRVGRGAVLGQILLRISGGHLTELGQTRLLAHGSRHAGRTHDLPVTRSRALRTRALGDKTVGRRSPSLWGSGLRGLGLSSRVARALLGLVLGTELLSDPVRSSTETLAGQLRTADHRTGTQSTLADSSRTAGDPTLLTEAVQGLERRLDRSAHGVPAARGHTLDRSEETAGVRALEGLLDPTAPATQTLHDAGSDLGQAYTGHTENTHRSIPPA